jgi:hypothetical protein
MFSWVRILMGIVVRRRCHLWVVMPIWEKSCRAQQVGEREVPAFISKPVKLVAPVTGDVAGRHGDVLQLAHRPPDDSQPRLTSRQACLQQGLVGRQWQGCMTTST